MKQKQPKVVYTPNRLFDCKRPLGWDEISRYLSTAIDCYNQSKKANYKVEVQAVGDPKMVKVYQAINHHRIWIEDIQNKKMHFSLLCRKSSLTNSLFLQDGVKYEQFLLMSEETSTRWLKRKYKFLGDFIPFIMHELSGENYEN